MINVQLYIDKLEALKTGVSPYVDKLAFSYNDYWVVVTDIKIPFPKNYQWVGHNKNMELSEITWDKHPRQGWSKPDKIFGGVEVRYLYKSFRPKTIA